MTKDTVDEGTRCILLTDIDRTSYCHRCGYRIDQNGIVINKGCGNRFTKKTNLIRKE